MYWKNLRKYLSNSSKSISLDETSHAISNILSHYSSISGLMKPYNIWDAKFKWIDINILKFVGGYHWQLVYKDNEFAMPLPTTQN